MLHDERDAFVLQFVVEACSRYGSDAVTVLPSMQDRLRELSQDESDSGKMLATLMRGAVDRITTAATTRPEKAR